LAKSGKQRIPYVILDLGKLFFAAAQEPERPHGDFIQRCWIYTPAGHMWRQYSASGARAWVSKLLEWREIYENPTMFPAMTQEEWYALRFVHRLAIEDGELVAYNKNHDELRRRVLISAPEAA